MRVSDFFLNIINGFMSNCLRCAGCCTCRNIIMVVLIKPFRCSSKRKFDTEITQGAFHGFTTPLVGDVHFMNQRFESLAIPPIIRRPYLNFSKDRVELYCRVFVNCQSFGFFLLTTSSRVASKIFLVALRPIS